MPNKRYLLLVLLVAAFTVGVVGGRRWLPSHADASSPIFVIESESYDVRYMSRNELTSLRVRLIGCLYNDAATARDPSLVYSLAKVQREIDSRTSSRSNGE